MANQNVEWMRTKHTVYALNPEGHNLWSFNVQTAVTRGGVRTPDDVLEGVAVMAAAAPSMYEALKAQTAAIKSLMDELCCYMDHDPTPMIHAEAARRQGIEALSRASPEKNTPPT